jgi:hypothetical protein
MYIIPFFRSLTVQRALVALTYVPFFLIYFAIEGLYLHSYEYGKTKFIKIISPCVIKIAPYSLLLLIQYGGMYFFNLRIFSGFTGFFLEFLWGIVPIFAVTIIWSGWLNNISGGKTSGTIFNTLIVSWVAAATFPF